MPGCRYTPIARDRAAAKSPLTGWLLALCLGLLIPVWLPSEAALLAAQWAAFALLTLVALVLAPQAGVAWHWTRLPRLSHLICLCLLAGGVLWHIDWAQQRLTQRPGEAWFQQPMVLFLCVEQAEPAPPRGQRLQVWLTGGDALEHPRPIELWHYQQWQLKSGDLLRAQLSLKPVRSRVNYQGRNTEALAFADGREIRGTLRQVHSRVAAAPTCKAGPLPQLRRKLATVIDNSPNSEGARALLRALLLGDAEGVSPEQWSVYQQSGTIHLLVVSGLHLVLVMGFAYGLGKFLCCWLLVRWISLPWMNAQLVATCFALFASLSYAALSGWGLPVQRALVMAGSFLGFAQFGFRLAAGTRLLLGLVLVLLLDPLAPMRSGFWFSFGAVAALLMIIGPRADRRQLSLDERPTSSSPGALASFWQWLLVLGHTQWVLLLALLLPGLYWNSSGGLLALPANLIAVPLVGMLALPLALLGLVLDSVGVAFASSTLLSMSGFLLQSGESLLQWLLALKGALEPGPAFRLPARMESGTALVLLVAAASAVSVLLLPGLRWTRLLALPLGLGLLRPAIDQNTSWLHVLDVGQGTALVLQRGDRALLLDSGFGRDGDRHSTAATVLHHLSVRHLDAVLLSHGDADHAGGLAGVLRAMPAPTLVSNTQGLDRARRTLESLTLLPAQTPELRPCQELRAMQWLGVTLKFMNHGMGEARSSNDASCIIRLAYRGGSVLLPGDIEVGRERSVAGHYRDELASDLLIVPHHGSRSSSSYALLKWVAPRQAVVSAGWDNAFGHPHPQVLARYRRLQVPTWQTAYSGMLSYRLADSEIGIPISQRKRRRGYWRTP